MLERQVRRMLADERSRSLVTNFAFQWLGVRRLEAIDPDPRLYPNFDEDLRRAFTKEMDLYLDSILREPRSVVDLLTANHTFVNERLARHYGLPNVRGDQFRRVELEDSHRFGLFGKGSVLMVTSYPDRTSPVLRGAWIMEQILAAPPNPPPPGVETDLAPVGDVPKSVRERLAHAPHPAVVQSMPRRHRSARPSARELQRHRRMARCASATAACSSTRPERRPPACPSTVPRSCGWRCRAIPTLFVQALTEKLLTFALGRRVEYYDMPVVRRIVADAESRRL